MMWCKGKITSHKAMQKQISTIQQNVEELNKKLDDCMLKLDELFYADLLHDTIINSTWLTDKTFSLRGGAANYSFIYILYRILEVAKPLKILEMGMGQTSRLTSQYVANCNPKAALDIIEDDNTWINTYKPQLAKSRKIKIHQCDLDFFSDNGCECRKYKNLNKIVGKRKYDFIIIDGPLGIEQTFPRSNILDLIKNGNLADEFMIIFDDAEREGEQNTINKTMELLEEIYVDKKLTCFGRRGCKMQRVITSPQKSFVKYL